jgi:hypothetical protein
VRIGGRLTGTLKSIENTVENWFDMFLKGTFTSNNVILLLGCGALYEVSE